MILKKLPIDEIMDLIREVNPDYADSLIDNSIRLSNIKAGTTKNTAVTATGALAYGLRDSIELQYDRVSLPDIYSGIVTLDRPIIMPTEAGKVVTIKELLPLINDKLGLALTVGGAYGDIEDGNVTLPAKNAYVDLKIGPSSSGSLRLLPGKLDIRILSSGDSYVDKIDNHLLPGLVDDQNNLTNQAADYTLSPNLATQLLYAVDFSPWFARENWGTTFQMGPAIGGGYYEYVLTDTAWSEINTLLESVGMAPLHRDCPFYYIKSSNAPWSETAYSRCTAPSDGKGMDGLTRMMVIGSQNRLGPYDPKGLSTLDPWSGVPAGVLKLYFNP